MEIRTFVIEMQ
ncbi:hypothetical protein pipiens_000893 [Culex pipiens pipiens]|uniref:Uncharacterized protein n=2 Tax=Culex pipiens complex TaxID=518105 RepID=A0ABD1DV36_CULPP